MASAKDHDVDPGSAAEMRAWLARWEEVDRTIVAEARALTPEQKLARLESLRRSAELFEWPAAMERDDERVRSLWTRLYILEGC